MGFTLVESLVEFFTIRLCFIVALAFVPFLVSVPMLGGDSRKGVVQPFTPTLALLALAVAVCSAIKYENHSLAVCPMLIPCACAGPCKIWY
jgi:hypothetical protein